MAQTIHPFVPQGPSAVPVEVQALDADHCLHRMPAHAHAFFELILITGGRGQHRVGGQTFDAVPGALFLIPPGVVHDCRCLDSASGWVVLFLAEGAGANDWRGLASPEGAGSGLLFEAFRQSSQAGLDAMSLDGDALLAVTATIGRIASELQTRLIGHEMAVRNLLQLMLVEVARNARRAGVASPVVEGMGYGPLVARVFADIDAHFTSLSSLRAAGHRLGLDAGYLTTQMRRETGHTYGHWLIERRMMEARRLLSTTDQPVAAIADHVGYGEVTSFMRRFREHHGTTPARWRAAQHEATGEASSNRGQQSSNR